ncbi:MAG: hypothetical protein ACLP70_19035, partial [Streptosporangiaceae bacterium]
LRPPARGAAWRRCRDRQTAGAGENHPRKGDDTSPRLEQVEEAKVHDSDRRASNDVGIANLHTFIANARHVIADLRAWGRVALIHGAMQLLAAAGVRAGNQRAATGLLSRGSR